MGLVHVEGVTDEQRGVIYHLDDGYDSAIAGTYGTIDEVESAFRSFVKPYVIKVQALEIEMLGARY